jgi:hypothetical protein
MKYNPATSTASDGFSRNNSAKVLVNQHTGYMNDGRLVNKGRGPTKGNDGSCHHSGMSMTGHKPMAAAVPALPAQGSVRDNINRGPQVRNPGGTTAMPKLGKESFNYGRGPTKGTMQ